MNSIKVPFSLFKKFALLISDTDVELVSWKNGVLERAAIFANDDDGLERFSDFLEKNAKEYSNASFSILANVIGEDYRVERVAHLLGKYKADFHNRRMEQLFRGVKLCLSFVQGREERGRREDIVLFYGMLTEGKVVPWMTEITKRPSNNLVGVHAVSFINTELMKKVSGAKWRKNPTLLMTLHEKGLLRQTHYDKGHVRFSRVSKIADNSAEEVSAALRKELERTIQYLNSLKIPITEGLDIQFVCPGNMVSQLRELIKSSEKIRFTFHDAAAVAQEMGLKTALNEYGKDSSLSLQTMFSNVWFRQLASLRDIRYYWLQTISSLAAVAFVFIGIFGYWTSGTIGLDALKLRGENSGLIDDRDAKQRQYNEEFGQIEEPPSSAANIEAVSKTFRLMSNIDVAPGQLIFYFARAYEQNRRLQIDNMRWYVTNSSTAVEGMGSALIEGADIYQVLEVNGEFLPVPNESYIDVANRADILMESFEKRDDIEVQAIELPRRELVKENLGGVLTEEYNVDAARSRVFRLRILWKKYDEAVIEDIVELRA